MVKHWAELKILPYIIYKPFIFLLFIIYSFNPPITIFSQNGENDYEIYNIKFKPQYV